MRESYLTWCEIMKQDYNRDPHQEEVRPIRIGHVQRAVENIDNILSRALLEVADVVSEGPIRELHTIGDRFEHMSEELHETAQHAVNRMQAVEPVIAENTVDFLSARQQMEADARATAAQIAGESVDFMTILNQAQTQQDQKYAA